ncbi:hypothetical protein [Sporosarcina cyprini]|uniref:hypothetical protein n=1 Tax=Sporosarcina cyprini TaxID=2910523 RepID=UPI001EE00454|nr:hypothetical protein [Sporosarcina cyprini]MCG3089426.1 hypothetical protein [Sporosarcina cyprini]
MKNREGYDWYKYVYDGKHSEGLGGLFDYNPLAIILFDKNDKEEQHGKFMGKFETWLSEDLIEYLTERIVMVKDMKIIDNEIRFESNKGTVLVTHMHLWLERNGS